MSDTVVSPADFEPLSDADYRRLFEGAPNLYLVMTPEWRIVAVSDAYLRATGARREEIVGRLAGDVFPENPADHPQGTPIYESMSKVLETGLADVLPFQRYDLRQSDVEGGGYQEHIWSIINSPVFGADGQVQFIIHRVEDVTDVARQQRSAEEQVKRTAELTQRANLLELDVAMRIAELRQSYRDLHQANKELNSIRSNLERQVEVRTADLQRRNQNLEEIAYAASHDLQEPLRAVAGYCQLLLLDYATDLPAEARDYLEKAVLGAQRMSAMIKGILQFARATNSAEPLQPIDVNLCYLDALASLEAVIDETHATVMRGELPTVVSDRVLLTQLLQNLIGNALKYRSERPVVVMVNARRNGDEWLFSVADNGLGIPADSRERVFSMFKRMHTGRPIPGTGIGLPLCRQIVEHHGGRIWIESKEEEGTTVHFTLPVRE